MNDRDFGRMETRADALKEELDDVRGAVQRLEATSQQVNGRLHEIEKQLAYYGETLDSIHQLLSSLSAVFRVAKWLAAIIGAAAAIKIGWSELRK